MKTFTPERYAICSTQYVCGSLDHLVGAQQDRWRYVKAEGLGGLEVDHQLERGRILNRQLAYLDTSKDTVNK
jgi:hypothetical protein